MAKLYDIDAFEPVLTIPEGQRYVIEGRRMATRIATWDDCHSGFAGCVRMPRKVNVDAAHVGQAQLADGSMVAAATLPMDTVHAPDNLDGVHRSLWYESTGKAFAKVRYSLDEKGIRADGYVYDDISEADIERVTAAAPSGDWQVASLIRSPKDFERATADFCGSCIVNIPGFSESYSKSDLSPVRLVASAGGDSLLFFEDEGISMSDCSIEGVSVCDCKSNDVVSGTVSVPKIEDLTATGDVSPAVDILNVTASADPDTCDGKCDECICGKKLKATMYHSHDDDLLADGIGREHPVVVESDLQSLRAEVAELRQVLMDLIYGSY